jgi:hypothetical protein
LDRALLDRRRQALRLSHRGSADALARADLAHRQEQCDGAAHALADLSALGLPDGVQMDNDADEGGYKVPRVFGAFVRLCLYVGIEPIFLPFGEPKRNSVVNPDTYI